ncbi:MAG: heparan-alpha-glucosaminide N-acetyltransferase domain-containing protein [Promethearchaeota archaeon]
MIIRRLKSIDTFRGLCMSWMVLVHLTGWWLNSDFFWLHGILIMIFDPIGASGFLFIAGVSIMLSHRKKFKKSKNSEQYNKRMIRNEYFFRALLVLIVALIYNTCVAIAINNLTWIWSWFVLLTIAVSFFIAWPLLNTPKYLRIFLGIVIWIGDKLILNILILHEGQPNVLGVLFHILYNGYHLDPILTFFPFFLFGTVVGDVIYDILGRNDPEHIRKNFKNHFFIPAILIGGVLVLINVFFQFPEFLFRRTLPWVIYSLGIVLILFSILLTIEIFGFMEREKSYKFLFYYSYYSLTVYLGHNILFFLFYNQLNLFNVWFFFIGAFIAIGLLLRAIHRKWSEKASLKYHLSKLSIGLARKIESRRVSQEDITRKINI